MFQSVVNEVIGKMSDPKKKAVPEFKLPSEAELLGKLRAAVAKESPCENRMKALLLKLAHVNSVGAWLEDATAAVLAEKPKNAAELNKAWGHHLQAHRFVEAFRALSFAEAAAIFQSPVAPVDDDLFVGGELELDVASDSGKGDAGKTAVATDGDDLGLAPEASSDDTSTK